MTATELRDARHSLGLSLAKMAAALTDPDHPEPPIHKMTIYGYETGRRPIPHTVSLLVKRMVADKAG